MFAVQLKKNGQLVNYLDTIEDAEEMVSRYPELEIINTDNASKITVVYTELGGPWGYGHQEPSFTTHGGIKRCIINLYKWLQECASVFGPDARDIRDFLRHCDLQVNDVDKTSWLQRQVDKINVKGIYC